MVSILLISTLQAWFFAFLIYTFKKNKSLSDYILTAWFLLIGLHTLSFFFIRVPGLNELSIAFPFLQGPFLYLYMLTKVTQVQTFRWRFLIHGLPFVAFIGYQYYHFLYTAPVEHGHQHYISFLSMDNPFGIPFILLLAVYILLSLRLSAGCAQNRVWHNTLIISMAVIWLSSLLAIVWPSKLNHDVQITFDYFIFILLTGFVYISSYFGLRENLFNTDIPRLVKAKYEKNALSAEESLAIWNELQVMMRENLVFLDSSLRLSDLADKLQTNPNKLSQAINEQSSQTFNDYVNMLRVNQAKLLMSEGALSKRTLLGIAYDAGFSSKSTFNRAFKKQEGVTPSEYAKTSLEKTGLIS